jgi:hypothetical protein
MNGGGIGFASRLNAEVRWRGEALRHGVVEGFDAEFVDGAVEDVFDVLRGLVAGALVFSRGADDDAVGADFGDDDVDAGLDGLAALGSGVDDLTVDFDGAAGEHFGAGDADAAEEYAAGVIGEHVVAGEGLAEEGFAHGGARPVFEGRGDEDRDDDHGGGGERQAGEWAGRGALRRGDDDRGDEGDAGEDADEAAGGDKDFEDDKSAACDHEEDGPGYVGDDHARREGFGGVMVRVAK